MSALRQILPHRGRGTSRRLVEGHARVIRPPVMVEAADGAPPPRATRAVPLPVPGRIA